MGDRRRFEAFADLIARNVRDRGARIADVAGGKGFLRAALHQSGFRDVTSWDKCKASQRRTHREGYRHALFDYRSAPDYDVVVGMHPDGGTDHIIRYAADRRIPAIICPCCIVPSAAAYHGRWTFDDWVWHLKQLARVGGLDVSEALLPIRGRNLVLIARPQ